MVLFKINLRLDCPCFRTTRGSKDCYKGSSLYVTSFFLRFKRYLLNSKGESIYQRVFIQAPTYVYSDNSLRALQLMWYYLSSSSFQNNSTRRILFSSDECLLTLYLDSRGLIKKRDFYLCQLGLDRWMIVCHWSSRSWWTIRDSEFLNVVFRGIQLRYRFSIATD